MLLANCVLILVASHSFMSCSYSVPFLDVFCVASSSNVAWSPRNTAEVCKVRFCAGTGLRFSVQRLPANLFEP